MDHIKEKNNFNKTYLKMIKQENEENNESTNSEETKLITFQTSNKELIQALTKGFEEAVFFVNDENDEIKEISISNDSISEVKISDIEKEQIENTEQEQTITQEDEAQVPQEDLATQEEQYQVPQEDLATQEDVVPDDETITESDQPKPQDWLEDGICVKCGKEECDGTCKCSKCGRQNCIGDCK